MRSVKMYSLWRRNVVNGVPGPWVRVEGCGPRSKAQAFLEYGYRTSKTVPPLFFSNSVGGIAERTGYEFQIRRVADNGGV